MARNWPGLCGSTVMSRRASATLQFVRQTCDIERKKRWPARLTFPYSDVNNLRWFARGRPFRPGLYVGF